MKNTVHNDATSSNLKGKSMTKTIGLHCLQQVTKHVPATDEASVHRASTTARKVSLIIVFHWGEGRNTSTQAQKASNLAMQMAMRAHRKIYGSHRPRSICGAYIKFTDTHIENGHFLCVYARAGEEITILRSIYADRKPSHRKPSHAKEKTSQTVLRLCVLVP